MSHLPWDEAGQPEDDSHAGDPWFYAQTYIEFQNGMEKLLAELERHRASIEGLGLTSSPYEGEVDYIRSIVNWGHQQLGQVPDKGTGYVVVNGVSYRSLRYLKAGILYQAFLIEQQRLQFIKKSHPVPRSVLKSFDVRIEQLRNMAEMGKLAGLRPADVFFELTEDANVCTPQKSTTLSPDLPKVTGPLEITIIDSVLRQRCLPLIDALDGTGTTEQFDTVIREMSVILEDRVREVSALASRLSGAELYSATMAKDPYLIRFSPEKDIQDSAHLFFRGFSGLVRNDVMHRLVSTYTRQRMLQQLAIVDYLLFLLSTAEVSKTKGVS